MTRSRNQKNLKDIKDSLESLRNMLEALKRGQKRVRSQLKLAVRKLDESRRRRQEELNILPSALRQYADINDRAQGEGNRNINTIEIGFVEHRNSDIPFPTNPGSGVSFYAEHREEFKTHRISSTMSTESLEYSVESLDYSAEDPDISMDEQDSSVNDCDFFMDCDDFMEDEFQESDDESLENVTDHETNSESGVVYNSFNEKLQNSHWELQEGEEEFQSTSHDNKCFGSSQINAHKTNDTFDDHSEEKSRTNKFVKIENENSESFETESFRETENVIGLLVDACMPTNFSQNSQEVTSCIMSEIVKDINLWPSTDQNDATDLHKNASFERKENFEILGGKLTNFENKELNSHEFNFLPKISITSHHNDNIKTVSKTSNDISHLNTEHSEHFESFDDKNAQSKELKKESLQEASQNFESFETESYTETGNFTGLWTDGCKRINVFRNSQEDVTACMQNETMTDDDMKNDLIQETTLSCFSEEEKSGHENVDTIDTENACALDGKNNTSSEIAKKI